MIWSVGLDSDCIVANATTMLSKRPILPLKEKHVVEKSLPQFIQRPRSESGLQVAKEQPIKGPDNPTCVAICVRKAEV